MWKSKSWVAAKCAYFVDCAEIWYGFDDSIAEKDTHLFINNEEWERVNRIVMRGMYE
jgi:hypothetical protein